ncbi:MAG: tetratricopeptide repeat protein [Methyloligellaceae bacterium]
MRTYKTGVAGILLAGAAAIALSVGFTDSSEADARKAKESSEKVTFASPAHAYRQGIGAYRAGRIDIALPALVHAAKHNNMTAMFLLARLHSGHSQGLAAGHRDELLAFQYYETLASNLYDSNYRYPNRVARVAGDVFIALAEYHRDGLEVAKIRPNKEAAVKLYRHAAVNYHDPVAEYRYALAYVQGEGVPRSFKNAVRWFYSSATKNYAPAQARLGQMYWSGQGLVADRARGLALLKIARKYAGQEDQGWIDKSHNKMAGSAGSRTKAKADYLVAIWAKQYGAPEADVSAGAGIVMSQKEQESKSNNLKFRSNLAQSEEKKPKPYMQVEPVLKGNSYITLPTTVKDINRRN